MIFINKSNIDLSKVQRFDFGCGDDKERGFIGVDCRDIHGVDLVADFEGMLTLPSTCASEIHSDHFVEHFEYFDVKTLIFHWSRMLVSGGTLRIFVPDLLEVSKLANEYWQNAAFFAYGMQRYPEDYHKSFWTFDSLREVVHRPCIKTIERIPYEKFDGCFKGLKNKWSMGIKAIKA